MSEKKQPLAFLIPLDRWLALHQRLCWLIVAAVAVLGAVIFVALLPVRSGTVAAFVMAVLLMLSYRWISDAPMRSVRDWGKKANAHGQFTRADAEAFLDYVLRLEKALPAMKKKEMDYSLTGWKAVLLSALGRKEEALSLLRGFDRYWDAEQKTAFDSLIRKISGEQPPKER